MDRKSMLKRFIAKHHKKHKKPNPKAPLGQGGRFAALEQKLSGRPGVTNPAGLAASIGRKKLGAKRFNNLSQKGR